MASPRPKLQKKMTLAIQHHQAGRLALAAQLYQEIIARDPRHADALRLLGVVAQQSGRHERAVDLLEQAIAVNRRIAEYHSDLGLALHALGRYPQAVAAFQAALQLKPNLVEAHFNLANTLRADGQIDHAIATYQIALQLQPRHPEALNNLGNALKDREQFDQAVAAYRAALAINPNFADALGNLGNALQTLGRGKRLYRAPLQRDDELDQAIAAYRAALALKPDDPQTHNNLGTALEAQEHFAQAIACYQTALRLRPRYAEALFNLGNACQGLRRFDEAVAAYRAALDVQPKYPEALNNLANALKEQDHREEAIAAYRAALELRPDFAEAHNNLGTALKDHGLTDEASASFRTALHHKPDYAEALSNLGNVFKDQGLLDESIDAFRQAVAMRPGRVELHNNLVYTLHFHPAYTPEAVAGELRVWNHRHAEPMARLIKLHENDRNPDRPLRIGWVSPDFRSHPIGRFLLPVFEAHERKDCLFFCYSDAPFPPRQPDTITAQIRAHADRWHNTEKLRDKELATLIRFDQVDILIDLTMHMQGSRLLTFAQKPAPVQMTYLAYPTSTGLVAMDYRLTDHTLDPPDADTSVYTEKPLRLRSYWCYPAPENAPAVTPLSARTSGHVTFACLNNFSKVSPQALRTWMDILRTLPESRLFLHAAPGSHRDRLRATLAAAGIDPARCEFFGFLPFADYLALHHRIDIVLDPFPYAGGTTSCDALYMGVPLVTWGGPTALSRGGVSILSALGLPELIAASPEAYAEIAMRLAKDLPRLEQVRATLRGRMEASPLMDAWGFARDFQANLRHAWHNWVRQ
jgi:predicted O-linked N-acetylglucosamine transferase (SPINDLY family)